jgi:hypothetical protein
LFLATEATTDWSGVQTPNGDFVVGCELRAGR